MLQTSLSKTVSILLVCFLGVFFTLPNAFYSKVEQANDARAKLETGAVLTGGEQAALEAWPDWLPSHLVNLGLDLRGGAHLLVEVKLEDVHASRVAAMWPPVRDELREMRDQIGTFRQIEAPAGELRIRIEDPAGMPLALETVNGLTQPVVTLTGAGSRDFDVRNEGDTIVITMSEAEKLATDERTMLQTLEIIRRRVDEAGTREPTIQRQGNDRVLVQVPGLGSAEELKELLGTTAKLEFKNVVGTTSNPNENPGVGREIVVDAETPELYYVLDSAAIVTGEQLVDAKPSFDQNGRPAVAFRFNPAGGRAFGQHTAENVGRQFAIILDNKVVSAPTIIQHIAGGAGQITGNFTVEESTHLAILLRAGALPAELVILEERTIGPELGQDSIDAGRIACLVAFAAVLIYMVVSYGLFGVFADLALLFNIGLLFGLLSQLGATLTLPGIAGIVLTVGMAVDANVLIFERIREEMRTAKGPARAIELGYEKAFSAIIDANITTIIAAAILWAVGSGPVRGFATTLGLGIFTSVFTAIFVTRLFVSLWYNARRPKTVEV